VRLLSAVFIVLGSCWTVSAQPYTISTFAGGGLPVNIQGTKASLGYVPSVAVDASGDVFTVCGKCNVILRMDAVTGLLSVVAGNGTAGYSGDNGLATSAQLNDPQAITVDKLGNLYIADAGNLRVRKVTNGVITTVAGNGAYGPSGDGGPAASASVDPAYGIAVDNFGDLFLSDYNNNIVREVSNGVITTVAGNGMQGFAGDNGLAVNAKLSQPEGVAVDAVGNLFIADFGNSRIRRVSKGIITTVVGNGAAAFAGDNGQAVNAGVAPTGVALDTGGNIYIADFGNNRIREVSNGVITTVAGIGGNSGLAGEGDGGTATNASLYSPQSIAVSIRNDLFIAEVYGNRVRRVSNGIIDTVIGGGTNLGDDGPATQGQLYEPGGLGVDSTGQVFVADYYDQRVRKISGGTITTVAGLGPTGFTGAGTYGGDNGQATGASLSQPSGVAVDSSGRIYIGDTDNERIRMVSGGVISTIAGNGSTGFGGDGQLAVGAMLNTLNGTGNDVAVDATDNTIYIADSGNNRVRKVDSTGIITTVAGNGTSGYSGDGGLATSAELNDPSGVAVDKVGNLYIADTLNHRVRKVSGGLITTVAGNGNEGSDVVNGPALTARLGDPGGVAVDSAGNLYIADGFVRKVSNGIMATIAGGGSAFGDNGPALNAQLSVQFGIAVDSAGDVFVADDASQTIRVLTPGTPPKITLNGIVPIYSPASVIQPGSWVSIYGVNLASGTAVWNNDFPQSLGGTTVTIDNKPAFLWVVSPTQINLQVPDDAATGLVSLVVNTASGTATSTVTLSSYGPSISLLGDGKHVAAEILTSNGTGAYAGGTYDLVGPANTFSYSTRPVKAGETLVLYGVGFGPTTPAVLAGKVFSGSAPTNNKSQSVAWRPMFRTQASHQLASTRSI
jgi:trimeric autotransporter adhesin